MYEIVGFAEFPIDEEKLTDHKFVSSWKVVEDFSHDHRYDVVESNFVGELEIPLEESGTMIFKICVLFGGGFVCLMVGLILFRLLFYFFWRFPRVFLIMIFLGGVQVGQV